jgi:hypothetical protein
MTQMAFPVAFPSTRRTAPAVPAGQPGWRLRGAGFAAALVVSLGTDRPITAAPADRGVMNAVAGPGTVIVGPDTRLVAVIETHVIAPTSWAPVPLRPTASPAMRPTEQRSHRVTSGDGQPMGEPAR